MDISWWLVQRAPFFLSQFLHLFVLRMNEVFCILKVMSDYRSREGKWIRVIEKCRMKGLKQADDVRVEENRRESK